MPLQIARSYRESEEARAFRGAITGRLGREWTDDDLRSFLDAEAPDADAAGARLRLQLGLDGLLVAEEHGGQGGTHLEAALVSEELGAALVPYDVAGACMAAELFAEAGATAWLERLASGSRPFALLWPGDDASWRLEKAAMVVVAEDGTATGRFTHAWGVSEDAILLAAGVRGTEAGVAVFEPGADGLTRRDLPTADVLRPLSEVALQRAPCSFLALDDAPAAFRRALALGATLLAADMVGAARSCVEMMVEYGLARRQFGQAIVTFQALKHDVVDAAVEFERARASTYRAARSSSAGGRDREAETVMLARIAKAAAGTALQAAARQSIQLHGATGFTWENLSHRFLRKWATAGPLLGSADAQRLCVYVASQGGHDGTAPA